METNPEEIQPKVAEAIGEGKLEFELVVEGTEENLSSKKKNLN